MSSSDPKSKRNIVFICLDQLAPDAIGAYGNRLVKTPNMDRLAAEGVTFEDAWCVAPLCGPARYSLFTGQMPFPNMHCGAACQRYPYVSYMGDYFRSADYATFSVGKLHGVPKEFDFGFEDCHINDVCLNQHVDDPRAYSKWLYSKLDAHPDGQRLRKLVDAHYGVGWYNVDRVAETRYFLPPELSENAWIAETSSEFLSGLEESQPFMMHIGINHPHGSWHSQPQADELVTPDEIELPANFEPGWEAKPIPRGANAEPFMMEHVTKKWSEHEWKLWIAKYLTSVNQADKAVGTVLSLLEQSGRLDDTTIILTTDHSDMCGQFQLEAKYFFYDGSARIPLIISGPGVPKGERRTQLCDQLDMIPTMLDCAGLSVPEDLEGVSLRQACANPEAKTKSYVQGYLNFQGRRLTMTLSDTYKLCTLFSDRGAGIKLDLGRAVELYDRRNDPYEYENVFGEVDNEDVRNLIDRHIAYFADYAVNEWWIKDASGADVNIPPHPRSELPTPCGDWFAKYEEFVEGEPVTSEETNKV